MVIRRVREVCDRDSVGHLSARAVSVVVQRDVDPFGDPEGGSTTVARPIAVCRQRATGHVTGHVEDAVRLDGDHAFGDCGSRRPVKAASKNPCHMRGNSSTEAGRGTSGCYVERPASVDSTSLAEALASRAGVRTTRPSWTLLCFLDQALPGHLHRIGSG